MKLSTTAISIALTSTLLVGGGVLVGGGAIAANATETPTGEGVCSFAEHLERSLGALPDELQADLLALSGLEKGQRKAAVNELREKALDGEYGDEAQQRAENKRPRLAFWLRLPDALRIDLTEYASVDSSDERGDLAEQISDEAIDGGYGPQVDRIATRIEKRGEQQSCGA